MCYESISHIRDIPMNNNLYKESLRVCPICNKNYMIFLTHKKTIRTHREIPVYYCMHCESFSNPSGYKEDEKQLLMDLEWHKSVAERNSKYGRYLFDLLKKNNVDTSRILEIGSGIGTILKIAKEINSSGVGYEVNKYTSSYASEVNNVDVREEFWTSKTDCSFTLLICIMVLEHIEQPRELIKNMVDACIRENASLFISVPFLDRDKWKFIHDPDPKSNGTPFFDNDVHVTHFSSKALEEIIREFGMNSVTWVREGLWHGPLARLK